MEVVSGAENARKGIGVALALPGTELPGLGQKVGERVIQGVRSFGMALSPRELGVGEYGGGLLEFPEDALEYIARQVTSNIRELEGALMRAIAFASLNGVELTRAVAAKALSDIFAPRELEADPLEIICKVADHFGLKPEELTGSGRKKEVVLPRQLAMYLVRELTRASLPEIGQLFGGRDHTTVLYAIQKVQELAESDREVQGLLRTLREACT